jgi:replicative DNA helicase
MKIGFVSRPISSIWSNGIRYFRVKKPKAQVLTKKGKEIMDATLKPRIPPHSREAEMMVLGCMLTSINSLNIAAERLEESDFYFSEHKIIFRSLQDAYKADRPADIHLVAEELKRQDKLQAVGGIVYLTSVAQYVGTSAYIEEYTEVVKNKSVLRQMVSSAQQVEKSALDEPQDVDAVLDDAQQLFFRIGQTRNTQAGVLVGDVLAGKNAISKIPFLKELEARQEQFIRLGPSEVGVTGIRTHFLDLDKMINGLNNSHLVILASRPAMGKTALALNIASNISFQNNIPVGIFSLEMTAEQLVHRIVCSESEVESSKIQTGSLTSADYQEVVEAVHGIQKHTIVIDDQPGLKITDLRARARRMKESHKVGLIIIDYLQLISGSGSSKNVENRQNEISEISRMLKILARELDIPILCLSQLSRKVEERPGHRPIMSDLRESGSIEQDADIIIFLLRREYYDPYDRPGQGELIVAKNRHGSIGNITLTYRKEIGQFANYSQGMGDSMPNSRGSEISEHDFASEPV